MLRGTLKTFRWILQNDVLEQGQYYSGICESLGWVVQQFLLNKWKMQNYLLLDRFVLFNRNISLKKQAALHIYFMIVFR